MNDAFIYMQLPVDTTSGSLVVLEFRLRGKLEGHWFKYRCMHCVVTLYPLFSACSTK